MPRPFLTALVCLIQAIQAILPILHGLPSAASALPLASSLPQDTPAALDLLTLLKRTPHALADRVQPPTQPPTWRSVNTTLVEYLQKIQRSPTSNASESAALILGVADLVEFLDSPGAASTVFLPVNDAYAVFAAREPDLYVQSLYDPSVRDNLLRYHVLQDVFDPQGTPISPSTVVKTLLPTQYLRADMDSSGITRLGLGYGDDAASILETIATTTGVVHVIDGVLPLPRPFGTTLLRAGLSRFLEWLVAPSGLGPFYDGLTTRITVLAPTDGAIDASQLLNGTSPSRGLLSSLAGFHTIALPFTASDIARLAVQNNATLFNVTTTLPGEFLLLSTPDRGRIMRFSGRGNQAFMGISHADLVFSQGVIHVLDGVLVPSSAAIAAASSDNSTRLPLLGSID